MRHTSLVKPGREEWLKWIWPDRLLLVADRCRARHSVRSGLGSSQEFRARLFDPGRAVPQTNDRGNPADRFSRKFRGIRGTPFEVAADLCQPRCWRLLFANCSLRGHVWIAGRFSHSLWRRQRSRKPKSPRLNQRRRPAARPASPGRSGAARTGTSRPRPRASRTHGRQRARASCGSGPLGEGYSSPVVEGTSLYTMYGKSGRKSSSRRTPRPGNAVGTADADDVSERRGAGDGQRSLRDAAHRRQSALHEWRRGPPPVPGQEPRARSCGPSSCGAASRLTPDVRLRLEPDRVPRHDRSCRWAGRAKPLMAFNQADGKVAWAKNDFGNVYSSPILIDVGGLEQLAIVLGRGGARGQPAQRRPPVADTVQGRLLDRRRDARCGVPTT